MPATAANLILQIQTPFAILLDVLIMKERLDAKKATGTLISVLGVGLVIGLPEQAPGLVPTFTIILGAFCWSLGQVFARKYGRDSGAGLLKANALGSVPQLALATCLFESGQWQAVATATWLEWTMLAFVGIVGFYLAYLCWFALLKQTRMDEAAPFILLMPVVGIVAAFFMLGENISAAQLTGGAVILLGLGIVSGVGFRTRDEGRAQGPASSV